ncbi:MAG: DUF4231 domain-containing protein [Pseudomonadota bacterium]|nr:DUF4231 domain-containing protein [Pseudomonadota bacterium]
MLESASVAAVYAACPTPRPAAALLDPACVSKIWSGKTGSLKWGNEILPKAAGYFAQPAGAICHTLAPMSCKTVKNAVNTSAEESQMDDAALEEMWSKYRGWAARARAIKAGLGRWRFWALVLTVAGAVLATLAVSIKGLSASPMIWAQVLSGASGVAMAMAAFLSRSMLDPAIERQWIQARSLAEASKSEAFKYATRVPPYDQADAGQQLLDRLQQLLTSGADVPALEVEPDERRTDLPGSPLPVADYIASRITGQVERFYRPKAAENERKASRCSLASQLLTALAAVLGAIGAIHGGTFIEAWVATLGTVAAAIGAFALANRYHYLAATYRLTADRLSLRLAMWRFLPPGKREPAADQALILDAEGIIAAENGAWLAELTGARH